MSHRKGCQLGLVPVAIVGMMTLMLPPTALRGQKPVALTDSLVSAVRDYRVTHESQILRELTQLLSIPNLASDRANILRNAERIRTMLTERGVRARLLESDSGPPAVYGELSTEGATRTIVFYAHFDGQPVDRSQWLTPPWSPTLRDATIEAGGQEAKLPAQGDTVSGEARLYSRSASDDKAPIEAMLAALDALRSAGRQPDVNLKFFFDGEEEAGSPHLRAMLDRYAEQLVADAWIFCDGPVHQSRLQQVVFGVRGTLDLEMTVYGPLRALHDGHYGNWVPNPNAMLANLLASMRDSDGRIRIAGFGADVRRGTPAERAAIARIPAVERELKLSLGLAWSEGAGESLVTTLMRPALNIRGVEGGHVGALAANAIPTLARASVDFRLVPDQTPDGVRALVEKHLKKMGYFVVHADPDLQTRTDHARIVRLDWGAGYPGIRTPLELPVSRAVVRTIEDAVEGQLVVMPMLGGSLPMYVFKDMLNVPLIVVPIVNHDNNQHAANENLRLQNLWDGIEVYAALMAGLGARWR
ncbi:MAG: M20/M25/M40 family metallo-hydrolase [Gemmatimonadota bacterium]|nr:M20/M25/M40 family metallo-hydrolase [Gemmatimonadota bacterium]